MIKRKPFLLIGTKTLWTIAYFTDEDWIQKGLQLEQVSVESNVKALVSKTLEALNIDGKLELEAAVGLFIS